MKTTHVLACVTALALFGAGQALVLAQGERGNAKAGQKLYEQQCLRCHGEKLDGQGPEGKWLIIPPANFQSYQSRSKEDRELLSAIYSGVLFSPMHGFREKLSTDDMRDILAYIRQMAPQTGV